MPGLTSYHGLHNILKPKEGETIFGEYEPPFRSGLRVLTAAPP